MTVILPPGFPYSNSPLLDDTHTHIHRLNSAQFFLSNIDAMGHLTFLLQFFICIFRRFIRLNTRFSNNVSMLGKSH